MRDAGKQKHTSAFAAAARIVAPVLGSSGNSSKLLVSCSKCQEPPSPLSIYDRQPIAGTIVDALHCGATQYCSARPRSGILCRAALTSSPWRSSGTQHGVQHGLLGSSHTMPLKKGCALMPLMSSLVLLSHTSCAKIRGARVRGASSGTTKREQTASSRFLSMYLSDEGPGLR